MSSQTAPLVPLSSILTVIITTSPTPTCPSTELLGQVLLSCRQHCPGLLTCRVIVVFDTYDRIAHKARLKRGCVTPEVARDFNLYKDNVKRLIQSEFLPDRAASLIEDHDVQQEQGDAEYGLDGTWNHVALTVSHFADKRVTFIEPAQRLGFGLGVRSALRATETPYVWVHQHDWILVADIPVDSLLRVMRASTDSVAATAMAAMPAPVHYVCLPSKWTLSYAESSHVQEFAELRALTVALRQHFPPDGLAGPAVPLTPVFFWFDKPHIASTAHYLSRVFPSRLAMSRGDFIEDTIGQRARNQMKAGMWAKWATWMYYPKNGKELCVRHLHGRKWKGRETYERQKAAKDGQSRRAEILRAKRIHVAGDPPIHDD